LGEASTNTITRSSDQRETTGIPGRNFLYKQIRDPLLPTCLISEHDNFFQKFFRKERIASRNADAQMALDGKYGALRNGIFWDT
jgi:hypothetical protein